MLNALKQEGEAEAAPARVLEAAAVEVLHSTVKLRYCIPIKTPPVRRAQEFMLHICMVS